MEEVDKYGRWHIHTPKVVLMGNRLVRVCRYCGKRMNDEWRK